jgi:hypothetical protein
MSSEVLSVTYEIDAMAHKDGNFSIPKKVCDLLGLRSDDFVHLIISHPYGGHLFSGKWQMKSGNEIYGNEIAERIKSGQRIRVTISKP